MPSATGIKGTGNLGVTRKYDVADVVSLLDVNRYPLLAILTNAGKDPVTGEGKAMKKQESMDPEFKWFEDEAKKMGFAHAACAPMVRSSYFADIQAEEAGIAI